MEKKRRRAQAHTSVPSASDPAMLPTRGADGDQGILLASLSFSFSLTLTHILSLPLSLSLTHTLSLSRTHTLLT